jgi:uncharacterized membrane protein YphA (DoxX/SURF4 family)
MPECQSLGIHVIVATGILFQVALRMREAARESPLQRLFSTFPGRWPGIGLLLLRTVVGATAVVEGTSCLAGHGDSVVSTGVGGSLALAGGLMLLMGFLTPVAGVLLGLSSAGIALSWFPPPPAHLVRDNVASLLMVVVAAAIILLGPGAFSIDCYLFGRREIIIPPPIGREDAS